MIDLYYKTSLYFDLAQFNIRVQKFIGFPIYNAFNQLGAISLKDAVSVV